MEITELIVSCRAARRLWSNEHYNPAEYNYTVVTQYTGLLHFIEDKA